MAPIIPFFTFHQHFQNSAISYETFCPSVMENGTFVFCSCSCHCNLEISISNSNYSFSAFYLSQDEQKSILFWTIFVIYEDRTLLFHRYTNRFSCFVVASNWRCLMLNHWQTNFRIFTMQNKNKEERNKKKQYSFVVSGSWFHARFHQK